MGNAPTPSRRCEDCGALPRATDDRFCAYCGAALPVPAAPPPPTPRETTARRFELLRKHPDARRALDTPPSGTGVASAAGGGALATLAVTGVMVVFALVFMKISAAGRAEMAPSFEGIGGFRGFSRPDTGEVVFRTISFAHTVIPLVVIAGALFVAFKALTRGARVASSPVRSTLALVVDEHQELRGTSDHRRSVHVATFEDERGDRSSFELSPADARGLARGDMGVLHARGPAFVDFERVNV